MNALIETIFLFIMLFLIMYFKLLDISHNNYIAHKTILFISILTFSVILHIGKQINAKCVIDLYDILNSSVFYALCGIVAYSLYVDINIMDITCDICSVNLDTDIKKYIAITTFITLPITISKIYKFLIYSHVDECEEKHKFTINKH